VSSDEGRKGGNIHANFSVNKSVGVFLPQIRATQGHPPIYGV